MKILAIFLVSFSIFAHHCYDELLNAGARSSFADHFCYEFSPTEKQITCATELTYRRFRTDDVHGACEVDLRGNLYYECLVRVHDSLSPRTASTLNFCRYNSYETQISCVENVSNELYEAGGRARTQTILDFCGESPSQDEQSCFVNNALNYSSRRASENCGGPTREATYSGYEQQRESRFGDFSNGSNNRTRGYSGNETHNNPEPVEEPTYNNTTNENRLETSRDEDPVPVIPSVPRPYLTEADEDSPYTVNQSSGQTPVQGRYEVSEGY